MVFRFKHGDRPLDGYTIQRGVGCGGFGEVYYALSDGGRQVALKALQHNQEIELRGVGQCMNLKSPHLVTIFDVKKGSDGAAFVIMEYVTGPSLRDLMRDAPQGLGPERAAYFVREIARGLGYLHERGVVHRDLKPENIFFEDGYVKIGDYGLSKYISVSRQSAQTISVGTVHYMAPEIGSGRYHRGIDIYALGVILYECLTGRVPFTGDSFGEILMKHLTQEPDLSGFETPFAEVLKKALAKSPDDRYARVESMTEDLLRNPRVEASLRDFRPESITRPEPRPGAQDTVVLGRGSPGGAVQDTEYEAARQVVESEATATATQTPPPGERPGGPGPARSPDAAVPVGAAGEGSDRGGFFSRASTQRHLLGLGTAASMAVVTSLLARRGDPSWAAGSFLAILAGAFAVLLSEREGPGKFVFEPGVPRRLMTLLVASPLYLLAVNITGAREVWGTLIALILSTAVVGWRERIRDDRQERIVLGQAFSAGLFAFIAAMPLRGEWILAGGVMAAISLVVNVYSPFTWPRAAGPERKRPSGWADGVGKSVKAMRNSALLRRGREATLAPAAGPLPPAPLPAWARVFWWTLSAMFFATSLSLLFLALNLRGIDAAFALSFAVAALPFSLFTGRVGWSHAWPGFWRITRWFLISALLATAAFSGVALLAMGVRGAPPAPFFLIFSLVFALFLGLLPARLSSQHRFTEAGLASGSPGWSALGALLVTMGISVALGSVVMASGLFEMDGVMGRPERGLQGFVQSRTHLLLGLAFFLPGLFCVLRSRQGLGATHVFRGAIGFGALGMLVCLASQHILNGLPQDPRARFQFMHMGTEQIAWLFSLGVLAAALLFWPARAAQPRLN